MKKNLRYLAFAETPIDIYLDAAILLAGQGAEIVKIDKPGSSTYNTRKP